MGRSPRTVARRAWVAARTSRWPAHSRLFVLGDQAGWVLSEEARELGETCTRLGIPVGRGAWVSAVRGQCTFAFSHFDVLLHWHPPGNRLGIAYLHGRPGTPGYPEFDEAYASLQRHHAELARVQVSHSEIRDLVLESGIDPGKVFLIPLGVDPVSFAPAAPDERRAVRALHGVPESAFVVGSLQKDGTGWGEGLEPKLVKGPDTLLEALELAWREVPELLVLLTGPARGYVRRGLERIGIPYRHLVFDDLTRLPEAYRLLDACIVSSRQEGGPKAALEAMASGVPLVTTRVGQAIDLVRHRESAWVVEPDDAAGLAAGLVFVRDGGPEVERLRTKGRAVAEANSYAAQLPLWRAFMDGFVESRGAGAR